MQLEIQFSGGHWSDKVFVSMSGLHFSDVPTFSFLPVPSKHQVFFSYDILLSFFISFVPFSCLVFVPCFSLCRESGGTWNFSEILVLANKLSQNILHKISLSYITGALSSFAVKFCLLTEEPIKGTVIYVTA